MTNEVVTPMQEHTPTIPPAPGFKLGVLLKETLIKTEDVHSKRQFTDGEEMTPPQKIQIIGIENGRYFKKRGRKSSSFRFIHGPPEVVNFATHLNYAFQLVDSASFVEPPPGFENFTKHTRPTRRIFLSKVQGRTTTERHQRDQEEK